MSDDNGHKPAATAADSHAATAAASTATGTPAASPQAPEALTGLMAAGDKATKANAKSGPDLESQALHAAEQALAAGEQALAAARVQLSDSRATGTRAKGRGREIALRALLAFNVLAMVVVAMLPSPGTKTTVPHDTAHVDPKPAPKGFNDPWNRALAAAEQHDFPAAIAILEQYLADNPRLVPSERLNVLGTLSTYAARAGQYDRSREFRQKADSIEQSHSLPADLVADAKAALARNDQEALRRIWARFLLQQRQIPSWLQKHVAEAYLQLGDSYRLEANTAAEAARLKDLEAATARLRADALQGKEKGK